MSRLPLIATEDASDEVRAVYDRFEANGLAKFLHQAQALAHHPPLLHAVAELLLAYYHHSVVDRRYLELAVIATSARNACTYCVVHHTPQAFDSGLDQTQVDAVTEGIWRDQRDRFTATDLLVLEYAEQMTADANRVDDALFDQLRAVFTDQQVLELTMRIATCGFFNRFNDVLRLPVETVAAELYETATRAPAAS